MTVTRASFAQLFGNIATMPTQPLLDTRTKYTPTAASTQPDLSRIVKPVLWADVFKIFHFHAKLTQFISELAQFDGSTVELKYPTNSFDMDFNAGTVTVTNKPYQP